MKRQPNQNSIPIIGADSEISAELNRRVEQKRARQVRPRKEEPFGFSSNDRKSARYEICKPVLGFPILPSREVSAADTLDGVLINIGTHGLKMLVDSHQPVSGMELIVGIEVRENDFHFVSGTVVSTRRSGETAFEVGLEFRGYMHEVLECEQVLPVLDTEDMRFVLPYPDTMLASMCKIGAAISSTMDAVMLCPNCHGIPTVRMGCSSCLSSNVRASKMIHHFACANVDFVEKFEFDNELVCQKCRTRRLIIGSDYEYLDGPKMCYDCGQANLEKIQIGHCLSCEHRFPMDSAYSMDIVGYRVKRLDLLHFIGAT